MASSALDNTIATHYDIDTFGDSGFLSSHVVSSIGYHHAVRCSWFKQVKKGHAPENITKLALSPLLALTRTSISVKWIAVLTSKPWTKMITRHQFTRFPGLLLNLTPS